MPLTEGTKNFPQQNMFLNTETKLEEKGKNTQGEEQQCWEQRRVEGLKWNEEKGKNVSWLPLGLEK